MKESVLWRRLDRAVGTRLRARYKNKESGVAMVMALMFILVVLLTSTLLLGILLSQALPYRNNSRNAQGKVAAEAGLQAGLSFLRTAESYYEAGNYNMLMPSVTADPSNSSLDETYAMETATASSSSTSMARVVTLYNVPVDDTSSGTTAVSKISSSHNQKLSYRIQIGYYDGDPNASGKLISDATKLSAAKYAVVISYGYVNRFPDGRSAGTESDPVRTAVGVYRFGQAIGSKKVSDVSPMRNMAMDDYAHGPWIIVSSYTKDSNGDLDEVTTEDNPMSNIWGDHLLKAVPDPRNDLCFVATTDSDGNVDPNKNASVGSAVRVFRKAELIPGTNTYKYSEYCKGHGKYRSLNQWTYDDGDAIKLNGTNLCMTGLDPSYYTNGGAQKGKAIRLTTCGKEYSPKISDGKVDPGTGTTWKDQGYDTAAELNDPNSLLNKYQKWGFYFGFINAGYVNFGKYGSADEKVPQYSIGPIRSGGSQYPATGFQVLYATYAVNANSVDKYQGDSATCDQNWTKGQYVAGQAGACFVSASYWSKSFNDTARQQYQTFAETLGYGGEAGWNTNQIVSSTGACLEAWPHSSVATTKQCYVNAAPQYSYCYSSMLAQNGTTGDDGSNLSWTYPCPTTSSGVNWKEDAAWYERAQDGAANKKLTTISIKYSATVYRPTGGGTINEKCYYVDSATVGARLNIADQSCSTLGSSKQTKFYRFEYVDPNSIYNYKFVLASTYDGKDNDTTNSLCLTEMTNGIVGYDINTFNTPARYSPAVTLQKCSQETTDVLGRVSRPQEWNGHTPDGVGVSAISKPIFQPQESGSISYASGKYVDAANWKW